MASTPSSEALLELAADILGPLVDDVVFVGGATVHLWLTEAAAPPVRATDDVDVICDVTSYAEYQVCPSACASVDSKRPWTSPSSAVGATATPVWQLT